MTQTDTSQTDTSGIQRDKQETLLILTVFHILHGIGLGLIDTNSTVFQFFEFAARLIGVVFLMHWFTLDARYHKYNITSFWLALLAIFALFAAPFYFLKTRGKQAWRTIMLGFLFMAGCGSLTLLSKGAVELATQGEIAKPKP